MDEWSRMRGGQIPEFGNWEYVNELPITQYFECARQAGLLRYSSSSGECNNHNDHYSSDLYHHHHSFNPPTTTPRSKQGKGREKRSGGTHAREGSRKQAGKKVFDVMVTEFPQAQVAKRHPPPTVNTVKKKQHQSCRAPNAVDEDLYQIPPELLKRKRRLGFFTRCLVPPCAV